MNTKLKCLLLDDELPGLTYLKMLCEQLPELEIVKSFNNPEIFLEEQKYIDYDLCILDIEMPGIDGLTVASQLTDKLIIFTTAYREYAADAFDINAVDYLRKPVKPERLKQAIQKAQKQSDKIKIKKNHFQLNTDKGKAILYFDQVNFITTSTTDSRDKVAFLNDGSSITIKNISFEKLLDQLPKNDFCRLNKKDVIAIKCVSFFAHDQVTISIPIDKKITLNLTENYRSEFVQKMKV